MDTQEMLEKLGAGLPSSPIPSKPSATNAKLARGSTTSVEDRAVALMGSGVSAEQAALALGVTPARISQLMAQPEFSSAVAEARYKNVAQHNDRDQKYNNIEDTIVDKLEETVHLIQKPAELLRAAQVVSNIKRRGSNSHDSVGGSQNLVQIILPDVVAKDFTLQIDINNQVKSAGDQDLLTINSATLLNQVQAGEVLEHNATTYDPELRRELQE